jgi:hypothetical protein
MAARGGTIALAGRMPGERIATRIISVDTAGGIAETQIFSITANLVVGRVYRVSLYSHVNSSTPTDDGNARIREDSITGTELQVDRVDIQNSATTGRMCYMEFEYKASVTGSKTFVVTMTRSAGAATPFFECAANRPLYMMIDYIRG